MWTTCVGLLMILSISLAQTLPRPGLASPYGEEQSDLFLINRINELMKSQRVGKHRRLRLSTQLASQSWRRMKTYNNRNCFFSPLQCSTIRNLTKKHS